MAKESDVVVSDNGVSSRSNRQGERTGVVEMGNPAVGGRNEDSFRRFSRSRSHVVQPVGGVDKTGKYARGYRSRKTPCAWSGDLGAVVSTWCSATTLQGTVYLRHITGKRLVRDRCPGMGGLPATSEYDG